MMNKQINEANVSVLMPCPFCGSDKLSVVPKRSTTYALSQKGWCRVTFSVRCNVCNARGGTSSVEMPNDHYEFLKVTGRYDFVKVFFEAHDKWNERK